MGGGWVWGCVCTHVLLPRVKTVAARGSEQAQGRGRDSRCGRGALGPVAQQDLGPPVAVSSSALQQWWAGVRDTVMASRSLEAPLGTKFSHQREGCVWGVSVRV